MHQQQQPQQFQQQQSQYQTHHMGGGNGMMGAMQGRFGHAATPSIFDFNQQGQHIGNTKTVT
jgi:hypothetical protein